MFSLTSIDQKKRVDKRLKTKAKQMDIVSTVQFKNEIKVITNLVMRQGPQSFKVQ